MLSEFVEPIDVKTGEHVRQNLEVLSCGSIRKQPPSIRGDGRENAQLGTLRPKTSHLASIIAGGSGLLSGESQSDGHAKMALLVAYLVQA